MSRPALRLKTKIVIAITAMVVIVVTLLSSVYFLQLVRQRIDDTFENGDFVSLEVFESARKALEVDLSNAHVKSDAEFRALLNESLQTDPGLNSLVSSIVGYSPSIYDLSITSPSGRFIIHSDSALLGKQAPAREDFSEVHSAHFWRQLEVIYGKPHIYEMRLPIQRDGHPFATIRVGISTVLMKRALQPKLNNALAFAAFSILFSLLISALVSNLALRPLAAISRKLDDLAGGPAQIARPQGADEIGVVSHKIEHIGKQMRDVQEVFSTLQENLDQIMATLQDGVLLFSREAKAIMVSASVNSFLGVDRGELMGNDIHEIFAPHPRIGSLVVDAFEHRRSLSQVEVLSDLRPGTRVQVSLDYIEGDGEALGALLTLRDAESVHRIEDELELSRRLAAIGRLTSGVAHEVKNPINAIVVHLELLRNKMHGAESDAQRHVNIIDSEIRRLDRVVQTLVDFTRPMELRLAETDLRRIVEDVAMLATPDAEKHGVHVAKHITDAPLPVKLDIDLVKQAIVNIVINGMQSMPNGGVMTISLERSGNEAVLSIKDEGGGIPTEIREKIFNLYFTTKSGGTGIGLPMSYRVMQLHNGSLDFATVMGQGTTFHLRFPLDERSRGEDRMSLQGSVAEG